MTEKVQLPAVLSSLQDNSISAEERRNKYGCLCLRLQGSADREVAQLLAENLVHSLQDMLVKDIQSSDLGVAQTALQTLGICLHNMYIVNKFTNADSVISTLCRVIVETTDKICCTRALWCINKQNLPVTCIKEKLHEILKAVEHGQCKKNFQSLTVEYEALCAVVRLLDQVPAEMERYADCWGKLVYPLLLHDASKIRQHAMVAIDKGLDAMMKHQEELLPYLLFDLKSDKKTDSNSLLLSQMTKLMNNKLEVHILKVWAIYIKLLGKAIHHGSLINKLLPIVEKGFKNNSPEVKVAAYRAWKELINNFSLNKDIISDPKRVKLVMQVFRLNNARSDAVAMEKVSTWWYFVCCLKETASLYFDVVCLPLLQYAVSGQINLTGLTPGKTPNRIISANQGSRSPGTLSLNGPQTGSPAPTFLSVQLKGCEILAHVLGKVMLDPENDIPQLATAAPEHSIILGVAFFVKHHVAVLGVVKEYFLRLGEQINDCLLKHIWGKTIELVKNVIQSGTKADSVDVLQSLLQVYEAVVENQIFFPEKLITLLEALLTLPAHVLSSSSYSLGDTVLMQHNGALFLLGCLFHHRILETSCNSNRFCAVADKLINLSLSRESSGLHVVEKILDLIQAIVFKMEKADSLAMLWMSLANPLNQHLQKTGDINQGTGLDYDFTCVLTALTLPVTSILPAKLSQSVQASLLKCWSKLYKTFSQLAALVNTAPPNIACEEICSKILPCITQDQVEDEVFLSALSHLLTVIVESVDFSSISQLNHFGFTAVSSQVRNQKTSGLQNLVSLVHLTDKLLLAAETHAESSVSERVNDTKKLRSACLSSTFLNLIRVLTSLFTHLTTSESVAALVSIVNASMGRLYELIGKKQLQGISQTVIAKAEKMWQDVVVCLQSRYSGPYDTEFLSLLSPLLQGTFLHPRQKIKSQTLNLWNATFAHAVHLVYPANLRPILTKVKDKAAIILPGWTASDVVCIQETPNSFISQVESQVSLPNIIGVRSPNKMQGSFLKKVVPENMSPLNSKLSKADSPQHKGKTKLALDIEDLKDDDFVVIKSSPKKKLVLTKHQKETLKERSTIPALYSNADSSQDLSLMDRFVSIESQMSMSDVISPSDTTVITISPFTVIKESSTATKEEHSSKMQNDDSVDSAMTSPSKSSNCKKSVRSTSSPSKVGKENLTDAVVQNMKSTKVAISVRKSVTGKKIKTADLPPTAVSVLGSCTNGTNQVAEGSNPHADCKQPQLVAKTGDLPFSSIFSACDQSSKSEINATSASVAASVHSDLESLPKKRNISRPLNNSLLDGIAEETVTEVVRDENVPNLHILVEESQQVASNKESTSEKYSEDLIEETPIKEAGDGFVAGDVDLCSKKLFGSGSDTKQVVPDSQVESEDSKHGLILCSGTKSSCASSDRPGSGSSETLFDSMKSDVDLTPPRSQIRMDISSLKLAPVVSLQRLSSGEAAKYSPKCVKNKRKKRNSFRKSNNENDGFEDSQSSVRPTTASSSDESTVSQQLKQSETNPPESEKMIIQKTENTQDAKNAVTETENDSVFIVEMYGNNTVEELSESESTQNLENKLEGKGEAGDLEIIQSDSELPTPRTSGRLRKTPQRLIGTDQTQRTNTRQNTLTDSNLSSPHEESQQKKPRRRLSQRLSMEVNCSQTPGTLGTQQGDVNKEENSQLCLTSSNNTSSTSSQVHSTDGKDDTLMRNLKSSTKKSSSTERETKSMKQQNKGQMINASVKVTGNEEASKWPEAQNVDQKESKGVTFELCASPISKQERRSEMNMVGNADDQLTSCFPEIGNSMLKCSDGDDDSDGHSSSNEDIPLSKLKQPGADGEKSKISSGLDLLEGHDISVEGSVTNEQQHNLKGFTSKNMTSTPSKKKKRTTKKASCVTAKLPGAQFKSKLRGGSETLSRTLRSSAKKCTLPKTVKRLGQRRNLASSKQRKPRRMKTTDPTMPRNEDQNTGVKNDLSCVNDEEPPLGAAKDEAEQVEEKVLLVTEPAVQHLKDNSKEPVTEALGLQDEIEQALFKARSMEEKVQEKKAFSAALDKNVVKAEKSSKQLSTLQPADKGEQIQTTKDPLENKVLQHLDVEVSRVNKFVSPLRSPPRRGTLFSQSEMLPSNKRHSLLTRASLILQRAKLGKSSNQPLHHGRGPLSITPALDHKRPGILKSSNGNSPNRPGLVSRLSCQKESPSSSFRPIHLPKIYSPFASPSAGILRKRKLSGNIPTDSPSPPNKQRRVCFNDTVETREIPSAQKPKAKTRLVGRGSPKPVNRCLAMPQNGLIQSSPLIHWPVSETKNTDNKIETDLSESPSTLEITPESQLNCKQPICPEYVNCDLSIDCILPQLTSTVWSAGLGQLIRAMNITTVGQLSALSEREVHNLPIKSPKLNTLRVALHTVAGLKSTSVAQSHKEQEAQTEKSPLLKLDVSDVSPCKDADNSIGSVVCDPDIESRDLLDDIHHLDSSMKSTPPGSPETDLHSCLQTEGIVEVLHLLEKKCSHDTLVKLPSSQLMQIYTSLNAITSNVVRALRNKCPVSPHSSQS